MLIRIWIRYSFLSSNARIVEVWTCSSVKSLMIAATRRAELDAFLRDTWDEFAREMWMSHGMHKVYKKKLESRSYRYAYVARTAGKCQIGSTNFVKYKGLKPCFCLCLSSSKIELNSFLKYSMYQIRRSLGSNHYWLKSF